MPTQPISNRRVIGPVPPRDAKGRLRLKPVLDTRVKANALGEPVRDKDGQPIMEQYDTRDPREYYGLTTGQELEDGALKGLTLYEIDLTPPDAIPEPLMRLYARNEADAIEVYKREIGATRFALADPKVTRIHQ